MVAQNQSLFTWNYQINKIKNDADPICRLCEQNVETIDHLVSGCPILTLMEYKD